MHRLPSFVIVPLVLLALILTACPAQTSTPTVDPLLPPTLPPEATATAVSNPAPTITPRTPSAVPEGGIAVYFGDVRIAAMLADTQTLRTQGLSGHPGLADDEGMWFDFGQEVSTSFWMKDMLFPLDMVWIDGDLTVVAVSRDVPAPTPGQTELPHYDSGGIPVRYVLEINAGLAERYGIEPGMQARIAEE